MQLTSSDPSLQPSSWPHRPLRTSGHSILNSEGQHVFLAGVNWPGHGKPMIPEGLQYRSISSIAMDIKSLGMNVVRLTYATEMIDDIFNSGKDVDLMKTFTKSLGQQEGEKVCMQVVKCNPQFAGHDGRGGGVGRLNVFDAVAKELAKHEIYVHLDNHISTGGWCCGNEDGNGWFGDVHFPVGPWIRGLVFMAQHAARWRAFVSMSLRNEPRDSPANLVVHRTYSWSTWYDNMVSAMEAVHAANAEPLIFLSGIDYDTTLEPVTAGTELDGATNGKKKVFDLNRFPFKDKIVFELHTYQNYVENTEGFEKDLIKRGYNAMIAGQSQLHQQPEQPGADHSSAGKSPGRDDKRVRNVAPIVMTEFGFPQDSKSLDRVYAQTLKRFLTSVRGGWMYWVLAGSYYERQATLDYDEGWGLYNRDWSAWRDDKAVMDYFIPMVRGVLHN